MQEEEGWFITPPFSPLKGQKRPRSPPVFYSEMAPVVTIPSEDEDDMWEEDNIDSDEASPEDLARRLVDAVGIKRARQYIDETQRGQIIWFSASSDDIRRSLPLDIQWCIIRKMQDGEDMRCMSYVCKAWQQSVDYLVTKQPSLLLPASPSELDGSPFMVVGCRGMIVPPVHNGKFCLKDQRIPIVSRRRGDLYIMAFQPLKFDICLLYTDKQGNQQTLRRLLPSYEEQVTSLVTGNRYDTVKLRFPPLPDYSKGFDPHCCLVVTATMFSGRNFVVNYPVRHLSSGSLLEVRRKIHGEFVGENKPAGFCVNCGKARKRAGNCPVCNVPGTIIKNAYKDWKDL